MSLAMQKLELELQESRMEGDQLRHQLSKQAMEMERLEENEVKWRGRYEIIRGHWEQSRMEDYDAFVRSRS
jgi:hypothetical protein